MCRDQTYRFFTELACYLFFLSLAFGIQAQSWEHEDYYWQGLLSENGNVAIYTVGDDVLTEEDIERIVISAFGTGKEIGKVARVEISNPLDVTVFLRFADAIMTTPVKDQDYVALDTTDFIEVSPEGVVQFYRTGTCFQPSKKRLDDGQPFNPLDEWRMRPGDYDETRRDDRIFALSEGIFDILDHLDRTGSVHTPFYSDPEKQRDVLALHTHRYVFSRESPDEELYVRNDLAERLKTDFKEKTGQKITSHSKKVQAKFERQINNFWSTIATTGERAKILVDRIPLQLQLKKDSTISLEIVSIEQFKYSDDEDWSSHGRIELTYRLASAGGPFVFNLYLKERDSTHWLIRNVQLVDVDRQVTRGYNFYFPSEVVEASRSLGKMTFGYSLDGQPLNKPSDDIDFGVFSVDSTFIVPHDDSEDLEPLKDIFPEGTKLPPIEDESKYDYPWDDHIQREMPNLDLISRRYPPRDGTAGDLNACVPAAFSNSMMWLRDSNQLVRDTLDKHFGSSPEADEDKDLDPEEKAKKQSKKVHRGVFEEAGKLMERKDEKGVWMDEFIRGKQDFMDKYKLPVKVKFQSMRVLDEKIFPDENKYGHYADNQNKVAPDTAPNAKLDIEWLWNEMENDEDVEMNVYCFEVDEEGELVRDENGEPKTTMEHCVTVIGMYTDHGRYHRIHIQDDMEQEIVGGTRTDDWSVIVEGAEADEHVRGMLRLNNIQRENERCYIMQMVSESVDPAIEFDELPPEEELDQEESFSYDPLDEYWPRSDLLEDVFKDGKGIPWWVWSAPPIIGGVVYFLLEDNGDDDVDPGARDDNLTVDCMGGGAINILNNDSGKGLRLVDVEVTGDGVVSFDPGGVITIEMATTALTIVYQAMDENGNTISGTLNTTVRPADISAVDDNYIIDPGITLNTNVLDNDVGTELMVTSNTDPSSGTATLSGDGTLTYISDAGFTGTTTFTYDIEGKCGSSDEGQVTITVRDTNCQITVNETITAELCASGNGEIQIEVEPPGSYDYAWSNGATTRDINQLSEGVYRLTIVDPETSCAEEFEFNVDREIFENYFVSSDVTPYRCPNQGEINIQFQSPGSGSYKIKVEGPSGSIEFTTDQNIILLSDFVDLQPGAYTIHVYDESLGEVCTQSIEIDIKDESPDLVLMDDRYSYDPGDTLRENILQNDSGSGLTVIDFEMPAQGTATISGTGQLVYSYSGTFSGVVEFEYVVRDSCEREDTATIFIMIQSSDCDFEVSFDVAEPECGKDNGRISAAVEPMGEYLYEWSTGDTTAVLDSVTGGVYTLSVTGLADTCMSTEEVIVPSTFQMIVDSIITENAGCESSGEITLLIDTLRFDTFGIFVKGPESEFDTSVYNDEVNIHDWLNMPSGTYTIRVSEIGFPDSCQQELMVEVGQDSADFEINIETEDAFCGAPTGRATARVSPVGNYSYLWSTGETTREVNGLPSGTYSLQVTDEDSGCTREQEFEIGNDLVSEFIVDQDVVPQVCDQPGDIILELTTPASGDMHILVNGPVGIFEIVTPPGVVRLSDHILVPAGTYQLSIWDESVGTMCIERVVINVPDESESIDLEVIEIREPSSPSAPDGSITCLINANPFVPDYQIFLNGGFWGITTSPEFTVTNLTVGSYTIKVVSGNGCESNEVVVEFDFSPLSFQWPSVVYPAVTSSPAFWRDPGPGQSTRDVFSRPVSLSAGWLINDQIQVVSGVRYIDPDTGQFSIGGGYSWFEGKWTFHGGAYWHYTNGRGDFSTLNGLMRYHFLNRFSSNFGLSVDPLDRWKVYVNGDVSWRF